jgi:hypothetical protein
LNVSGIVNKAFPIGGVALPVRVMNSYHGLIERIGRRRRYRPTERGVPIAAFWRRTYNRLLRPGLAQINFSEVAPQTDEA